MPKKLAGIAQPRLYTEPLRQLTRKTTRGYEVIDFAEQIGEPLLAWQQEAVKRALELKKDGSFRFSVVLILVARQNGKSSLKRIVSLWRLYIDGARLILGCAQDVSIAREQWNYCLETIRSSPDLKSELDTVRNVNGDEWFRLASGGRYRISASNSRAGRGLSVDELTIDELRTQHDWAAWSALSKTTMARPNAQIWCMSNAGDDQSVVLNQLRDRALSGEEDTLCLLEWSAPDGCELDDPQAWAQANPALGTGPGALIHPSAIRSAMATDPPAVFRTEVLCQRVDSLDSAIDPLAWHDCADPGVSLDDHRERLAVGFDVAPDGRHATLIVAGKLDDGTVRLEVAESWDSAEQAHAELPEWLEKIKPKIIAWFPAGPAAALAPLLRPMDGSVELTGGRVTEACQGLADAVKGRRVLHPADPLMDAHIAASTKLPSGDGWRFKRRTVHGHVDAAYAAAGAVYAALTMPEEARPRMRVLYA